MTGLLARYGLSFLAPFILPVIVGLLAGAGGGIAWWLEYTDVLTAGLLAVGLGLIYALTTIESKPARVGIMILLVGLVYLKGRVDELAITQEKLDAKDEAHAQVIVKIKSDYKAVYDSEIARQKHAAEVARETAEKERAERQKEILGLRETVVTLRKEADDAKNANRPALDVGAIERINRVRVHSRK